MRYYEFIQKVQEYAGLDSPEEAARATEASLETLGERLSRIHSQHLAAQLPEELKPAVLKRATKLFPLEEFYNRVAARVNLRFHEAFKRTHAVMRVLREAVSPGELDDILSEMPGEFDELFGRKPSTVPPIIDTHQLFPKK